MNNLLSQEQGSLSGPSCSFIRKIYRFLYEKASNYPCMKLREGKV